MHTHKNRSVPSHRLHEACVSLREHRLLGFATPPPAPAEDAEAGAEGGGGRRRGGAVNMNREELGRMMRDIVREEIRNTPGVRDATDRRRGDRGNENREGGGERQGGDGQEGRNRTRTDTQDAPATPAPAPVRGGGGEGRDLSLSKRPDSGIVNTVTTAGVIGGTVAAGMNAAKLASVPVLGKFAAGVGSVLNSASAGVSSVLTQVGAPAQLSVLANPWVLGIATPALGLWMLGRYRIRTLRSYFMHNPSHPDAQATLEKIKEIEQSNFFARNWMTFKEGTKFVAGAARLPFRIVPDILAGLTGRTGAFFSNIGSKLGGLKGALGWPFRNAKHLFKGALWGAGAGIGTYAAIGAALGTTAAVGPLAIPAAVLGGGIYGYLRSKKAKGASPELAAAGT